VTKRRYCLWEQECGEVVRLMAEADASVAELRQLLLGGVQRMAASMPRSVTPRWI
jgi:hypothetical protein